MKNKKIAILGATGHIAKGLICNFSKSRYKNVFLFARSLSRLQCFLDKINCKYKWKKNGFDKFNKYNYDVIINCVGLGTPSKLKEAISDVFGLTERFDNMIIEYLAGHPITLYINFSSGAVYGTDFSDPTDDSTFSKWNINNIKESDYYGIAKLNSEAKHRVLKNFNIVDLRIFNYFSRFMELDTKYLLGEIILCLKNREVFKTDKKNITRDFIHPMDLFSLVEKCIARNKINDVFDAYSKKQITKFEILEYFKKNYGLKYMVKKNVNVSSITGNKDKYYSKSRKAGKIG
ncbi:MAG: NAD-dependent epimerase/dehydratase family protein, partial [Elusimicrobiota bacterium]|nr:NAD-dependent epimerase/dehydratase family protein [Elusimicrobiota bacterium]